METMTKINKHLLIAAIALSAITVDAREKQGTVFRNSSPTQKVLAGCSAPQSSAELKLNNVRTIIFSGSDMWWDLFGNGNAWYYVPKVDDKSKGISSCFTGNVWYGGLDLGGQLKIAAQTYRQGGIDFWTGPLSTVDASVSTDICSQYDKIFKVTRAEVDAFALPGGTGVITDNIKNWPGNGDISLNQDQQLAPFVDADGDAVYTPEAGDYPYYDIYNNAGKDNLGVCKARIFGDETLWWVYNDNGDVHVATGGKAIGLEVRAQAFAFKTTDEINNMTFYSYQIINRSSFELTQTYMTVWTDADLGYYGDDYIGCDVKRGLGYIYNSDNFDESLSGTNGYGSFIPALGCDFFQGPINTEDGIDNDNDLLTDEPGEQMGMTKFMYFNNNFAGVPLQTTDPQNATQYYQYMTGFWRDGTPFTCGGNGYGGAIPTSFVYPGDTYPGGVCGTTPWSESGTAGDRRFMQSSGPFNLKPGAINYVTIGLPWARTTTTDQKASIPLLKIADDKAQALFDNCFKVLSGPEAPDMTIQELNNELIIYLTNKPSSNNYLNEYKELDVSILVDTVGAPATGTVAAQPIHFKNVDRYYHFEGYKIYQLKNDGITQEELIDASKAKLVFACDVNNGVKRLINYEFDPTTGGDVPKVKVEGSDNGIQSTFRFTQDQFSTSVDKKVVNNKTYYFIAVAYGYNQYSEYKEDVPWQSMNTITTSTLSPPTYYTPPCTEGQKHPYLEGRKSKKAYGIPHTPDPEKDGTISNSLYGYGPKITRYEGQGNGGNYLDLTTESMNAIINNGKVDVVTYENGKGPINVKVVDPLNVPNSEFSVKFITKNISATDPCYYNANNVVSLNNTEYGKAKADSVTWVLRDLQSGKEYVPCKSIKVGQEYYFSEIGLSVNIGQVRDVANIDPVTPRSGLDKVVTSGDFISASLTFDNASTNWLSGVADKDGTDGFNWIRSGGYSAGPADGNQNDYEQSTPGGFADPDQIFEGILGGTWAPYALTAASKTVVAGTAFSPVYAAPAYEKMTSVSTTAPSFQKITDQYDLRVLSSVDIVFTKDKSKWTRAIVLEEQDESVLSVGSAKKLAPRQQASVDKQGVPYGDPACNNAEVILGSLAASSYSTGLGWFPGYAVNLETGERLNIAFGEDSYLSAQNGADMMWNPTAVVQPTPAILGASPAKYIFGGKHYIYVFGHTRSSTTYTGCTGAMATLNGKKLGVGNYNDFSDLVETYKWGMANLASGSGQKVVSNFWSEAMWVNIPLLSEARYAFKNPADMPCDAKVKLRVRKPYKYGTSGSSVVNVAPKLNGTLFCDIMPGYSTSASVGLTTDIVAAPVNNNFGYYKFSTADIFTEINNANRGKSALDLINVVPNPYYAYSTYEKNRIDNLVRITNLPNKCKIKIFTLNGTLVRTFDRDVSGQEDLNVTSSDYVHSKRLPYQDWDLKNQSGITVASGLYIIHIDVPGVGEKILKWFGVMRPLDLQSY